MSGMCLHRMFRDQAEKTPENVAIMSKSGKGDGGLVKITYRELNVASDKLAAMLLRHGVKKDSCIGILMDRCNEYALAYIGILKAGGAYLPLDPAYPEGLLADVLKDSQPEVVVCTRSFVARLPESQPVILLDSSWDDCLNFMTADDEKALSQVDEQDLDALAYLVYSSGTTGKPKGIACPHRGAVFSYEWRFENVPYGSGQEVEGCNVFFVWEMLRPLLRGQALVAIPDNVIYDPDALSQFVETMGITRMLFTPSLLEAVLDCKSIPMDILCGRLRSLTVIILCGEVVTVALQQRVQKYLPGTRLWNLYSVSECHDVAAVDLADGNYGSRKYAPVGKLFPGVEAHVFDENMNERAIGEEGELFVAGPTLARAYINLPELTQARFPTINGIRMYRTGDRARVLPNRELEILGRCDSMVKIRGYSVEIRAIEAAIMALEDRVSSCCVLVQGEEGEDKFVVGYVVLKKGTCKDIRRELKSKLPHYMVPAYLVDLEELPTHAVSGKLDKKALPMIDVKTGTFAGRSRSVSTDIQDCTYPRNKLEEDLHTIWSQIMSIPQIDVTFDSFFDIGGHSLLAAKLVQAIKVELGHEVGVVDLFAHSTIESLAKFISGSGDGKPATSAVDLDLEVEVHDASKMMNDITMRAFWRSTRFAQVRARSVLLTGVTGYLGAFLLYELLQNEDIDVAYCIVRPSTDDSVSVLDRVKASLQSRNLWKDGFQERIQVFAGDASLHQLGLEDDEYAALSTGVDLIIHCAAAVNLVYPYEGLRAANVLGTRNMIEFALLGKVKRFGYISTNGIFPDGLKGCKEDDDVSGFPGKLTSGYSQTKWVAEQLVRKAAERGLPVVIFRPGNMGGDSGTYGGGTAWNMSDFNYLFLTGCIDLGAAPEVDGWIMEMTPVDVAARGIMKTLLDTNSLGETYHVTNFGNCAEANVCFDAIRGLGYNLQKCSFEEWKKQLDASPSPSLAKLKNACVTTTAQSLRELSTFDNAKFTEKCTEHGIILPKIGTTAIHEYVETWQQQGLIQAPIAPGSRALHGKVVVITGASSGIGAAIAQTLAEAGASVGLGGRRIDRLKELGEQMERKSGVKTACFQVDVTNRSQVKAFVDHCEQKLGSIDIFVNNAGVMFYTKLKNLNEDNWEKEVDVNIKGLLHGVGAVLPKMLARGKGHILATSSDAGRKVFPGLSVYSGTKFFVEAFCQGLRLEHAGDNIKVTTIQPGDCKTELSGLTTDEEARAEYAQPSNERQFWLDPEDVARAVLFAVSAPSHVGINEVLIEPRGAPA